LREEDQRAWLKRKLEEAGAEPVACAVIPQGLRRSAKEVQGGQTTQTHCGVLFDGLLEVCDPIRLQQALECGLGAAKGYGFGLLSLAPARSA
jgi:CRISPR system Cascade subunit CasE